MCCWFQCFHISTPHDLSRNKLKQEKLMEQNSSSRVIPLNILKTENESTFARKSAAPRGWVTQWLNQLVHIINFLLHRSQKITFADDHGQKLAQVQHLSLLCIAMQFTSIDLYRTITWSSSITHPHLLHQALLHKKVVALFHDCGQWWCETNNPAVVKFCHMFCFTVHCWYYIVMWHSFTL